MAQDRYTYGNHVVIEMDDFSATITDMLTELTADVRLAMNEAIRETLKAGKDATKNAGSYQNRTGKYRASISYRMNTGSNFTEGQIYASSHQYSLTHLLENGHKLWNRPLMPTRAFPHWQEGWDVVEAELDANIDAALAKVL